MAALAIKPVSVSHWQQQATWQGGWTESPYICGQGAPVSGGEISTKGCRHVLLADNRSWRHLPSKDDMGRAPTASTPEGQPVTTPGAVGIEGQLSPKPNQTLYSKSWESLNTSQFGTFGGNSFERRERG